MSLCAYHGGVRGRGAALFLVATLVGCGAGPNDWPEGRPQIEELEFLQQSSGDPWSLQFLVVFKDTDGDLGQGSLELSVNGELKANQKTADLYKAQTPEVPVDAMSGELEVQVKLQSDVPVGEEIDIGFVLVDGQGQRSNEPSITLKAFTPGGG